MLHISCVVFGYIRFVWWPESFILVSSDHRTISFSWLLVTFPLTQALGFWGQPALGRFTTVSCSFHYLIIDLTILQGIFNDFLKSSCSHPRTCAFQLLFRWIAWSVSLLKWCKFCHNIDSPEVGSSVVFIQSIETFFYILVI